MKIGNKYKYSKPSCPQTIEEIPQSIKDDLTDIKQRILKYIKDNTENQCDENIFTAGLILI